MGCKRRWLVFTAIRSRRLLCALVRSAISRHSRQGQNHTGDHRCIRSCQITQKVSSFERHSSLIKALFDTRRNDDTTSSSVDPYTITGAGFQFLLMNRRSQVWFFIIHLLETRQVGSLLGQNSSQPVFLLVALWRRHQ